MYIHYIHYIYLFTNRINGKYYVGQTNNLKRRYNSHKSDSYNKKSNGYWLPFHCAIRNYGLENFTFQVIEEISDGESQEYVNNREKYFIQYYKSLVDQNGYNLRLGDQKTSVSYKSRLFTEKEIQDIQKRLINDEEYDDIEKIYAPRLKRTFLCNINTGNNFFNPNFDYPLKKNSRSKFSQREIQIIKNRIKRGDKYADIQKDFNIKSAGFLSMINTGKCFYDKRDTYPLCNKGSRKQMNEAWTQGIIKDLLTTKLSIKEIAKKWDKSISTINNINVGRAHHQKKLTYPLRK